MTTKKIISTLLGLIVIAVLIYALLSTTDILRKSDPNNQKLNDSMNAIDKQAMDTIGTNSKNNINNNSVTSNDQPGFGYWFLVGAGIGLGIIVVIGVAAILFFVGRELWDEYGPTEQGFLG